MTEILPDEHEVPTGLGERVPVLALYFPFDWTLRQEMWMAVAFYIGSQEISNSSGPAEGFGHLFLILLAGVAAVILEYVIRPTPEFWLSGLFEYFAILVISFPLWVRRLLPDSRARGGMSWPLATLPRWLGKRLVQNATVLPDGTLKVQGRPGQKPSYSVAIEIQPQPHPDLLPEMTRETLIWARLAIFRRIQGKWSIHLQVRPFDSKVLEIASGPAWNWVSKNMAGRLIRRRPSLVLHGADPAVLKTQADTILTRFRQASMLAWIVSATEARALAAELWSEVGHGSSERVRIGIRRVMTGARSYRSWALVELPRIIHLTWLRPLTSESLLCDLAIHVKVRGPGPTRRSLSRRKRQWRALARDEDYDMAYADAERTLDSMRRNIDTEATVAYYVTAREEQAPDVAKALESSQCEFRAADFMQHRALRATRPFGGDPYGRTMKADLRTVATTDLLATAGYWPTGATLWGEALSSPEPIGINPFDDTVNLNWSLFFALIQGGGKTTSAQTLAWRMANPHPLHPLYTYGVQIVSVDYKASGDYKPFYQHLAEQHERDPRHCLPASYNMWQGGSLPVIEGHMGFNLSDVPEDERGDRLLELSQRIEEWAVVHALDHPLILILDEILALIEARNGASFVRRFGTQGRSSNISTWFMTQDVEQVLANRKAALAFRNAGHIFLGRQNPAGINAMAPLLSLDNEACHLLASAPQGSGLLRIERKQGPVVLGLQVRPSEWELREFGTNPSERLARRPTIVHTGTEYVREEVILNGHSRTGNDLLVGASSNGTAVEAD